MEIILLIIIGIITVSSIYSFIYYISNIEDKIEEDFSINKYLNKEDNTTNKEEDIKKTQTNKRTYTSRNINNTYTKDDDTNVYDYFIFYD